MRTHPREMSSSVAATIFGAASADLLDPTPLVLVNNDEQHAQEGQARLEEGTS
jgi:hypothetical protein